MKLALVGGRLQGMEACYLARKACIQTLLIDRAADCPARGLADGFIQADVRKPAKALVNALKDADMILPTCENSEALAALRMLRDRYALKLAFDFDAYEITRSKRRSDALMHANGIPAPAYYPGAEPPYIFKPSGGSGSAGVRYFKSRDALAGHIASLPKDASYVAQEYVEGPSYSIEVIGVPGDYRTYQITQIHIDEIYDCNRVTCPCALPNGIAAEFSRIAKELAGLVDLHGIMDVETILHNGVLKVLEIDARLPSQTPTAIYRSTGINFIAELAALFAGHGTRTDYTPREDEAHTVFAHIEASKAGLRFPGEHIMASRKPVTVYEGLFGADEVITDWKKDDAELVGTFIAGAESAAACDERFESIKTELKRI